VLFVILFLLNSIVNTKFFMNLSKLQKVDLRNVWKHGALDFTQWLLHPEKMAELSDVVGLVR
jgi:hypothetical protein